jgi:RND family efflux transporter MFP subunit
LRIDRSAAEVRPARWPWIAVLVVVVLAVVAAGLYWTTRSRNVEVRTVAAREVTAAGRGTVLNASGYVTARRRATVSSKITGKLVEVNVEEGMPAAEGQVLARLDDVQFRASLQLSESELGAAGRAVEETRVELQLAKITSERTQRLVDGGVSDQAQLDADQTRVQALRARLALEQERVHVAESQVALRRTELRDTVIRAPFDGIVVSKDAQPGEMISPISAGGGFTRTGICTLVDMSSLEIEVDVNESYISRVHPDQPVEAVLDAYPDWIIPARVIIPVPTADRQKATVMVRIAFEELDPRILPDMGIKVAFLEERSDAAAQQTRVVVPQAALRQVDGKDVLFVVQDGRVERRAVRVGATRGDEIEINAGLRAGERVVAEESETLNDGQRVVER